jgi:acyl carrier protein
MVGVSSETGYTSAVAFSGVALLSGAGLALPSYMVPSRVIGVREWPRTSSAKIDRKRLPAAEAETRDTSTIVAPRSAAEASVREAFASVLGVEASTISVEARFVEELGGTSLKAVLLARELAKALDVPLSVADVRQLQTAASIAASLLLAGSTTTQPLPPLETSRLTARRPLGAELVSWNQTQLLTVYHAGGATAAYNIPMPYWLMGPLQAGALRAALSALVERHEVLRTTYEVDVDSGGFTQRVGGVPELG